jgi:cytochrome c556
MRKDLICGLSVLSLMVLMAAASETSEPDAPKTPKEVMGALFKGPKSAMATLKTALKSESPDWESVQKTTKSFAKVAADLPKSDPPKGDKASFQELAKLLAKRGDALEAAAAKKDLEATKGELGKIGSSCMTCHKAHRPS